MLKPIVINKNFDPPDEICWEEMVLEVLSPDHNELDYAAWNSSKVKLTNIFGPKNNWPNEVSSLEENLSDLQLHFCEHQQKIAYTYSILDKSKERCVGCLYIRRSSSTFFDSKVDFWFIDEFGTELDEKFLRWLDNWLKKDWGLKVVAYPGRRISWEYWYALSSDSLFVLNESEREFWKEFIDSLESENLPDNPNVFAMAPGGENNADKLLQLYLEGKKNAGSGLVRYFQEEDIPLPEEGDYWIVLNSKKEPKLLNENVDNQISKFKEITEEVAIAEGEGDLSIEAWKKEHREFFEPYVKKYNISDLDEELIITEFFKPVFSKV